MEKRKQKSSYDKERYEKNRLNPEWIVKENKRATELRALKRIHDPVRYKAQMMVGGLKMGKGGANKIEFMIYPILGKPCKYCLKILTMENISLDHKIPLVKSKFKTMSKEDRDSLNAEENLQIICLTCNRTKGNFTSIQFESLLSFLKDDKDFKTKLLGRLKAGNFIFGR